MKKFRADFFQNRNDEQPVRSIFVDGDSDHEALEIAATQKGDCARVDVGQTVFEFKWRADFFENRDDKQPVRSIWIEADTENEAAHNAAKQMGHCMRVDVVRTIFAL
jgi:DNA-dependent RNA polymerase auxiliary subunit epsilon